jgi:MinD-like ATPase involved in chromosome partitioning or flagellar assembly
VAPYRHPDQPSYLPRVPQVGAPTVHRSARHDWRSTARRGLTRLAGLSTTRDSREYVQLHRRLTTAVTSGRRILVLSIEPAQGSTTVAALLATALATRRADPVLLVDAAAISVNPLHRVLEASPARTIRDLAKSPPEITSRAGFADQLTPVGRDVWLLPGDEIVGQSGRHAPDATTYVAAVAPFGRYFDITITDLGCSPGYGTAELLLDRAHALCLITSATREGFDAVTSRLRQLRDTMATPWAGRTLVVANRPRPGQGAQWLPRSSLRRSGGVPVVQLAFDPGLAPGFPGRLAQLAPETHLAALRLAAGVIDTAVPR